MISGILLKSHAPPMRETIVFAVFHAVALASAGLRFEPERKNNRVNVMNMKVRKIDHPRFINGRGCFLNIALYMVPNRVPKNIIPLQTIPITHARCGK